ncbi:MULTISPECIES: membrane protein insertase YidC [Corynebacterium]|uniref:membrane protein insertase YidC n=1 Tax=Corynebacterium TaxID=1716 RepID=UPI001659A9F1|nr:MULTISPECIES: membrane protein insertase YidC [Corynebacterium]QNP92270.1 membrane protein insertase YidC [Corynebacterium zhongnanshanii]
MLNFVYYPISAVLWFWHKVWSLVLDPASGVAWALSIIFLVFTIRILLVKPMANQMRSARKMAEFQPKMQALQAKYKNDRQTLALEMRKLQKDMGVNPLASCLPMLVQFPIFIGLFHVLRSFNRTGTGTGQLGMTIEETRNTGNYVFSVQDVQSFLDARLFGTPLSAYISMAEENYGAFAADGSVDFTRTNIILLIVPMMLISAVLMHFSARMSLDRQKARQAANPNKTPQSAQMQMQMDMMQKMMLWVMPVLYLLGGFMWQVGLATYMLANNTWTFVQQKLLFDKMDREEVEEREAKAAAKRTSAPQVGVRPNNPKKKKKK